MITNFKSPDKTFPEVLTNDLYDDIITLMNSISISQLKINPSVAIAQASDFPLAIESRNEIKAYIIGKDLYELFVAYMEDSSDHKAVEETDFSLGRDLEDVAENLGL